MGHSSLLYPTTKVWTLVLNWGALWSSIQPYDKVLLNVYIHDLTFYHFGELNLKCKFMTHSFLNLRWASTVGQKLFSCAMTFYCIFNKNMAYFLRDVP